MLYNRCIDDNGVLTWVMLVGTSLEANDRFLGSARLVLRNRRPISTNQVNWYHCFVIAMPDAVPLIYVSERDAQMEKFCNKNATPFIQNN